LSPGYLDVIARYEKGEVQRDMTFSDRSSKRSFESNLVSFHTVNRFIRNDSSAVLEAWGDVHRFPLYWYLGRGVDFLD
jgi:hypothetical protein